MATKPSVALDEYKKSADNLEILLGKKASANTPEKLMLFKLWYTAAIIHNETCRELYYFTSCPTLNTSKMLVIASVIRHMYEAWNWYRDIGNNELFMMACRNGLEMRVKKMLASEPKLPNLSKYKDVRNKISGHYDFEILDELGKMGGIARDEFVTDLHQLVKYGGKWTVIARVVGSSLA